MLAVCNRYGEPGDELGVFDLSVYACQSGMGNTPSLEDAQQTAEQILVGAGIRREKSWVTLPMGRHQRLMEELHLSERRYIANMQVLRVLGTEDLATLVYYEVTIY